MHEMSIAESLLRTLEDQSLQKGFRKVKKIWLEIGPLAVIDPESLSFYFTIVSRNTLAEGASLIVIDIPGQALCQACGKTVSISQRYDACNYCGSYRLEVLQGDEMRIKELEVY